MAGNPTYRGSPAYWNKNRLPAHTDRSFGRICAGVKRRNRDIHVRNRDGRGAFIPLECQTILVIELEGKCISGRYRYDSAYDKNRMLTIHMSCKGVSMRLYIDHSQPSDSIEHRWTETVYDGKLDNQVFEVPPHWHKYHDEIMVLKEGEIDLTIDGVTIRVKAGPERYLIPRRHTHSLKCVPGVRSVLQEKTNPAGEFKEWFFRDFFAFGNPPEFLHVMRAFWDGDVYPALPLGSPMLDQLFLGVFGGFAKLVMPAKRPLENEPWPLCGSHESNASRVAT